MSHKTQNITIEKIKDAVYFLKCSIISADVSGKDALIKDFLNQIFEIESLIETFSQPQQKELVSSEGERGKALAILRINLERMIEGLGSENYVEVEEMIESPESQFAIDAMIEFKNSEPSSLIEKQNSTSEWKTIHEEIKKAEGFLAMYEKYIKQILEFFDEKTVFDYLEDKGVDTSLKWNVHKLLFHYSPEMSETILKYLKKYKEIEIDNTDFNKP